MVELALCKSTPHSIPRDKKNRFDTRSSSAYSVLQGCERITVPATRERVSIGKNSVVRLLARVIHEARDRGGSEKAVRAVVHPTAP